MTLKRTPAHTGLIQAIDSGFSLFLFTLLGRRRYPMSNTAEGAHVHLGLMAEGSQDLDILAILKLYCQMQIFSHLLCIHSQKTSSGLPLWNQCASSLLILAQNSIVTKVITTNRSLIRDRDIVTQDIPFFRCSWKLKLYCLQQKPREIKVFLFLIIVSTTTRKSN